MVRYVLHVRYSSTLWRCRREIAFDVTGIAILFQRKAAEKLPAIGALASASLQCNLIRAPVSQATSPATRPTRRPTPLSCQCHACRTPLQWTRPRRPGHAATAEPSARSRTRRQLPWTRRAMPWWPPLSLHCARPRIGKPRLQSARGSSLLEVEQWILAAPSSVRQSPQQRLHPRTLCLWRRSSRRWWLAPPRPSAHRRRTRCRRPARRQ